MSNELTTNVQSITDPVSNEFTIGQSTIGPKLNEPTTNTQSAIEHVPDELTTSTPSMF